MENQNNFDADLGTDREFEDLDLPFEDDEEVQYLSLKSAQIVEYISADGRSGTVVKFTNSVDPEEEVSFADRLRLIALAQTAVTTDYVKHSMYSELAFEYDEDYDEDDE